MKPSQPRISRRSFLLAATAGTAATAAAIVAPKSADTSTPAQKATPESSGYQLTDHVRNYYRTAKI